MPDLDLIQQELLSPSLQDLILSAPMPGLGSGPTCPATSQGVAIFLREQKLAGTMQEAALWLLAGELDKSHAVSQDHKSSEGSFWHGIMHRREGDFWNSKYWFRQCRRHLVHHDLAAVIEQSNIQFPFPTDSLTNSETVSDYLVDLIQQASQERGLPTEKLQQITWWEWQLLFKHSL